MKYMTRVTVVTFRKLHSMMDELFALVVAGCGGLWWVVVEGCWCW